MKKQTSLALLLVGILGALLFAGYQAFRPETRTYGSDATIFTEHKQLASFSANGVRTEVFLEADTKGMLFLRATFTPIEQGFHLYSKDLDTKKTGGVGRATEFELVANSSIKVVGGAFTDVAPERHAIPELKTAVDIYPDGPVTLRLPVEIAETASTVKAQVLISYMACQTDGVCLPPVDRKFLDIELSAVDLQPKNPGVEQTSACVQ